MRFCAQAGTAVIRESDVSRTSRGKRRDDIDDGLDDRGRVIISFPSSPCLIYSLSPAACLRCRRKHSQSSSLVNLTVPYSSWSHVTPLESATDQCGSPTIERHETWRFPTRKETSTYRIHTAQGSGIKKKKPPWSESASELYRPSDRRLSAKWLPTFAVRGCHVVSVTDSYGRILGFIGRSHYFSLQ
jgi:hypothetical protein